jgi:predicted transcriptional regulator
MTMQAETAPRRRDKLVIMAEILDIAKDGALKTQIMFRANLSFSQLTHYLKLLTTIKLLSKTVQNGREIYKATSKGKDFLTRHEEIMSLLYSEGASTAGLKIPPLNLLKMS